jgi:hypothetical protein
MEEIFEAIIENWAQLMGAIGTILAVIFCRTRNAEAVKISTEKKLQKAHRKNEKAAAKLQENLRKEAELEKAVKDNA